MNRKAHEVTQKSLPTGRIALSILIILLIVGVAGLMPDAALGGTMLFFGGLIAAGTLYMFFITHLERTYGGNANRPVRDLTHVGKPKRGENPAELMSPLNDEDIEDLRARAKARLEEQIDRADIGEMKTFEDLLAEAKQKRGDR